MDLSKAETERLARSLLQDKVISVLFNAGRPLRTTELVQRSSNGMALSREYLRQELTESSFIVFSDRKWDLGYRQEAGTRPIEGLIEEALRSVGKPLELDNIARELSSLRRRSERHFLDIVPRLLRERPKYVEIHGDVYVLEDWLFEAASQDEEQVILENFLNKDPQCESVRAMFASRRVTDKGETADWIVRTIETYGKPMHHRLVSYVIWRELYRKFDPVAVWRAIYDDSRLHVLYTGECLTDSMLTELQQEIRRKSKQARKVTSEAEVLDVEGVLKKKLTKAQMVKLTSEDIDEVIHCITETNRPVSLDLAVMDVFDLLPCDDEFPGTLQALAESLEKDQRLQNVGAYQYHLKELVPPIVEEVPDVLQIERVSVRTMDDEEVDVLLTDNGLEGGLAQLVTAAEWEDYDEQFDVARVSKSKKSRESVRYAVPYHHYLAGTMKYRELDDEFFPMGESGLLYATFLDDEGEQIPVWISEETGLIYGLGDWYQRRLEPCGSVFAIEPTERASVFKLVFKKERDPWIYIAPERVRELEGLREEAASRPLSVFDIMCRLMSQHGRGVEFMTLWAEVNIVRRTSKRMIASNLSGYHCFYQPGGKSNTFFTFDERRLDQGFNRKKRRYIMKEDIV